MHPLKMHQLSALGLGLVIACTLVSVAVPSEARTVPNDLNGSNFTYPFPVKLYKFYSQAQDLEMAYMDVLPATPNGRTIVLLHGVFFCSATWNETAIVLLKAGYRVVLPDQIGFCKSTKPERYQFSLQQLALNTIDLLKSIGVDEFILLGHSMGGMLATRFALMYPSNITELILVDPVGLEDYKALGVPYLSIDLIYAGQRPSNYTTIRGYEQVNYYAGNWSEAYDVWVYMVANIFQGPEGDQFSWNQALVTDMVLTQPVVYEFPLLKVKRTLLMVGDKDIVSIGKQWSPPAVQALLGHFNVLGKQVIKEIPNGTLIEFPDLGHCPFIQDPAQFQAALFSWL